MTCERYREIMSAELDGEATTTEHDDLHEHQKQCNDCRQHSKNISVIQAGLASTMPKPQPAHLWLKIRAHIGIHEPAPNTESLSTTVITDRHGIPIRPMQQVTPRVANPWGLL